MPNLETVLAAYIACALWAETDNADDSGGEPLDANYDSGDIALESIALMRADCEAFIAEAGGMLADWDDEQIGHDFWLTRNGHGAGFWDRGKAMGQALTDLTEAYGTCDLYVGDDGKLYIS